MCGGLIFQMAQQLGASYLVKVEDQIEFADVAKEGIQDLDKEVNSLKVGELVVVGINAQTKEQTGIATVDDLEVAELRIIQFRDTNKVRGVTR